MDLPLSRELICKIPLSATEYSSVSYVLNTAMITSVTFYHWRRSSSLLYLPTTIVINTLSIKTISSEFYLVSLALTTILLFLVTSAITIFSNTANTAYAHIYNNITQEWKDRQNNIKIQFSYLPEHRRFNSTTIQYTEFTDWQPFEKPCCKNNLDKYRL